MNPTQSNTSAPAYEQVFGARGRAIPGAVATLGVSDRVMFLRKTYAHLTGAIFLFVGLEYLALGPLYSQIGLPINKLLLGSPYGWLLVLGGFMAVGHIAQKWAQSPSSRQMQYMGLGLYVVAETIIFVPLLTMAKIYSKDVPIIPMSAVITLILFGGLTGTVLITKKDFSFLGNGLRMAMFAALGIIVASILFGFSLGLLFSGVMLVLAAGYVLYYTSQVLAHYHPQQYVAASLALFAAIALMFWYVVRIVMALQRR